MHPASSPSHRIGTDLRAHHRPTTSQGESLRARDDRQAQPPEVLIEREAGYSREHGGHDNERDRVTEREPTLTAVPSEYVQSPRAYVGIVLDEMNPRIERIDEGQRGGMAHPVPEQRDTL